MTHTILTFLKFGDEARINEMYEKGTIFINTIEYFRKHKSQKGRGDPYEGVSRIKNYPPGEIEIKEINYKGKYLNLHIKETYEGVLGNIFSLYSVSSRWCEDPSQFKIDKRMLEFGSHCLMIKDNQKFLTLLENKLQELGFKYDHNFITYYDKNEINGEINLFKKNLDYEYQREFRFYIENDLISPIKFEIGSLKEIAEIHPTKDIIELELRTNTTI
jgi:hypothetical protein